MIKLPNLLIDVRGRRTSVSAELRGAVATFLTMAYILPTNANILAAAVGQGQKGSLIACTALAAGICCILMGVFANFPMALASGMGLNALVAFTLAGPKGAGTWQAAMGMVVLDGLFVLLLVLAGLREAVMNAIPKDLRLAIGAGIGLFIALIGLSNAGIVVQGVPAPPNGPLLQPGLVRAPATAVALIGLLITAALLAWRLKGALVIGIVATTLLAMMWHVTSWQRGWEWPSFSVAINADVIGALKWRLMPFLFAVMMVDFFDTLGTATAIAEEGDLHDADGRIPNIRRLLIVDSVSASIGGALGVSSNTCYIESAAGVAEGARTGLHSVFVGVLFLLAMFLAPVAAIVPPSATAPALILVGFLMMKQAAGIDFERLESAIPAFVTLLTIPASYSIAHGVGFGFVAYVAIQLLTGRWRAVHPVMYGTAAAFAAYFIWAPEVG
jgi:AGZA family xanthine/uracil permease-like MFS transporter